MNKESRGFDKKKVKQIKEIIVFSAIVILLVYHSAMLGNLALLGISIVMPFIIGGAIAFIINMPMVAIENKLLGKWKGKLADKLKRPISFISSIVFICAIVALVIGMVVPQLVRTISDVIDIIPGSIERFINWMQKMFANNPQIMEYLNKIDIESLDLKGMLSGAVDFARNQIGIVVSGAAGLISGIAGGLVDGVIAVIFAIYVLLSKERLSKQVDRLTKAYLKEKRYNQLMKTAKLLNKNFNNFLTGQCFEAVLLGIMFFVVMTIADLPYAALAGVLIGVLAVIPVVGAFIGCFICAFLILMVSPVKALVFLIIFLILQQIDGNIIYPRVVGNSVGLPAMWVLMAVGIGASLMGIVGMIIFIPIFSTIYTLIRDDVNERLAVKEAAGQYSVEPALMDTGKEEEAGEESLEEETEENIEKNIEEKSKEAAITEES